MTQRQLAARADLTIETISDIERGATKKPYIETLARIAEALDMTLAALVIELSPEEEAAS